MAKIEAVELWKDENGEIKEICVSYEDRKYRHYPAAKIPGTAKKFLENAEKVSERNSGGWVGESYMIVEHKEERTEKEMARKEIFVGLGTTHPPVDDDGYMINGQWEHERVYVVPLMDGISDNLWKRIYETTNEYRPMYGKDGSAVYYDDESWQIVRKIGKQIIKIANVVAYC